MRILKVTLIMLLALVGVVFCLTTFSQNLSGTDVAPAIRCGSDILEVSVHDTEEALLAGVTATDRQDGDLTGKVLVQGVSKLLAGNTAKVTYLVFDSDGNMASCTRRIHYTDYAAPRFAITEPLHYSAGEAIELLDRLEVTDVIDGDITDSVRVSSLSATSDPEVYTVSLQVTNSMGDTARVTLPVLRESGTTARPQVTLTDYLVYRNVGDTFRASDYLDAVTTPDGSGELAAVEISGTVDTAVAGTYMVYYRYYHNTAVGTAVLTVVVEEGEPT